MRTYVRVCVRTCVYINGLHIAEYIIMQAALSLSTCPLFAGSLVESDSSHSLFSQYLFMEALLTGDTCASVSVPLDLH